MQLASLGLRRNVEGRTHRVRGEGGKGFGNDFFILKFRVMGTGACLLNFIIHSTMEAKF